MTLRPRTLSESHLATRPTGHAHFWDRALSRRRFMHGGALAALAVLGSGWASPPLARAAGAGPKPIPGGIEMGGEAYHLQLPAYGVEPSTITDFNGAVGMTQVQGPWSGGGVTAPAGQPLVYDSDMRFIVGEYVGTDGRLHKGAFAFVRIDLYVGPVVPMQFGNQIHDFDPGITENGLFWTVPTNPGNIRVNAESGEASLTVKDLALLDYFNVPNALKRGNSKPATVSFQVNWAKGRRRVHIRDPKEGFEAELVENTATMTWSATTEGKSFKSGSEGESISLMAEVGRERNGVFFPKS